MDDKILLLQSKLKEVIWGNTYFKDVLKLTNENKLFGEYWTLSGYKNYSSVVKNGDYKGYQLDDLFQKHRELFSNSLSKDFPILIKVIATSADLSVQVHPNDEYAKRDNDLGKTESWLILNAEENSKIVYGNNAQTKKQFSDMIKAGDYDNLLDYKDVKPGMFVQVNAGTLHALGKGLVLIEVQQSSNLTYRVYDYNRRDFQGNLRQLHIDKAIDVTKVPDKLELDQTNHLLSKTDEVLWNNEFFNIELKNITNEYQITNENHDYYLVTVAEGEFEYNGEKINLGDSFIITSKAQNEVVNGSGKLVVVKSYK